ncbi:hypothetical protein KIW84_024618 [Lathyrus oleraceus]|uniref:Uncharacterized protein n=1 Tax=Pisum sativum TaxID=3888 RepID=A0A9D4YJS2_PEA|nr:hypothetical protein KIW84_024618 [Pisum sativum]
MISQVNLIDHATSSHVISGVVDRLDLTPNLVKRGRGRPKKATSRKELDTPFTHPNNVSIKPGVNTITNIEFISPPFTVPKLRFTSNTVAANQQPTLPIFAPIPNLELNSENEEGSDYDPFLDYYDLGDAMIECKYCKAMMWYQESMDKHTHAANPKYYLCCGNGKVELPMLKHPPQVLSHLLFDHTTEDNKNFQS